MGEFRCIAVHPEGVTLEIRIKTRSSKVGALDAGLDLKWGVSAPPIEGKANEELESTVAKFFGVKRSQVALLVGKTSKNKVILVKGVTAEEANRRLLFAGLNPS